MGWFCHAVLVRRSVGLAICATGPFIRRQQVVLMAMADGRNLVFVVRAVDVATGATASELLCERGYCFRCSLVRTLPKGER